MSTDSSARALANGLIDFWHGLGYPGRTSWDMGKGVYPPGCRGCNRIRGGGCWDGVELKRAFGLDFVPVGKEVFT